MNLMVGIKITQAQLDNWFTYHAPTGDQADKYLALREAGKRFAEAIVFHCPPGPDTTAAVRKVREAVIISNASIACGGQ